MLRKIFVFIFFLSSFAGAAQLPRKLDDLDRIEVLKILGFGSAAKLNSDPTPLGGHGGFEFFFASDVISIADVQKRGDQSGSGDQIFVSNIGFGKGLFYDIDAYVFFSPLQFQNKYSQMGASVRKVVYTHSDLPLQLSLNFHGSGTNYENLVGLTTTGLDFILSYDWFRDSVSAGLGHGRSIGTFIGDSTGGPYGINSTSETYTHDIQQRHWFISVSHRWEKTYLSLQYDRYFEATYSLKLGYRL